MSCYYAGSDQPRMIRGRHGEDCAGEDCKGCQPCREGHCRVCGVEHSDGACPECLTETREALTEITRMCNGLRTEVTHRGVASRAMTLLGPTPDPEARYHAEVSYLVGRLPEGWLETGTHGKFCPLLINEACTGCGGSEHHPLTVAWWWNECYREAFDHDETPAIGPRYDVDGKRLPDFGVADLLAYLDRNLAYAATFPDVPFEDFAHDLRQCRTYMERVLHDGEQVEQGAPCLSCETVRLELVRDVGEDRWACPRCNRSSNEAQYRFAVRQEFIQRSPSLNADDMAIRTGVGASTIRRWTHIKRDQAKGEDVIERPAIINAIGRVSERKVYLVADVEFVRDNGAEKLRGTWLAPSSLPTPRAATVSTGKAPLCPDIEAAETQSGPAA